jgi:hypothetical protein
MKGKTATLPSTLKTDDPLTNSAYLRYLAKTDRIAELQRVSMK